MANWEKKIRSGGGDNLEAGEELVGGMLVNPYGLTSKMVGRQLGGVVGAVLTDRAGAKRGDGLVSDEGIAAQFPDDRIWLGLTTARLLVWGHGAVSGKPKGLKFTIDRNDLERVELEKLKTAHAVVLRFRDGTAKPYEAPKMFNDPEAFAASANAAA